MTGQLFKVEETNTYVRIFDFTKQTEQVLRNFCFKKLARWQKVPGNTYGSYKFEITHIFASFSPDKTELRLIKGFYQELLNFINLTSVKCEGIIPLALPVINPANATFKWKKKEIHPRDEEQCEYLDFTVNEKNKLVVINIKTGGGKANHNKTLVQIPGAPGWAQIGSLKVGDEVIARDGTITIVTGVYPQGELPINEMTFYDGRKSYCCDNHLWKVFDVPNKGKEETSSVINTIEIKKRLSEGKANLYIPLVIPYNYASISLPDSPFWYGAILINNTIPELFFNSSVVQRLNLFHWLMEDSQLERGVYLYHTKFLSLANDIQKLVWSLGGIAKKSTITNKDNITYKLLIPVFDSPELTDITPKLKIKKIESAGVAQCTCISVSHPEKLFVIDDYIVTHNTVISIMAFVKLGVRVVITVLPRYVAIWRKSFSEFLDLKPEDVLNVSDHDINDVYTAFKENTINPKIVFFQLTRVDTYIKRMREFPDTIPHLDDFFSVMRPGIRVIDEAHESIYSVYSSMLYGNIAKNIALSATLLCDDEFVNKIYRGLFPNSAYLKPPIYDKYINVISYYHRMNMEKYRINTKGFGGYSHVLYEKGILKSNKIFENYYQMCKEAFIEYYLNGKREGQKAIWFFSTIKMCNRFSDRLKKDYPTLDIFVFTGEVSKKKGMEQEYNNHDIVITTPGSCATGKDIEKLYIVFAGISVSSMQRVDQMSGRVRPIDKWWPDLDPIFLTFVCKDVRKQVEYDWKKKRIIGKKAKCFTNIDSSRWV